MTPKWVNLSNGGHDTLKQGSFKVPTLEEIREARKKKVLIKVLSVYADESYDAKCERTFAVAGIIGTQEEWDELEVKWIKRTGGKSFHATDCKSRRGDYKNISYEECIKEYEDLTKILAESRLFGIGSSIDINAFKTFIPGAPKYAPYFYCFMHVIFELVGMARLYIPPQKVRFTFDINDTIEYNATYLYNKYLIKLPELKYYTDYMHHELGFTDRQAVGIQVADLFAGEVMNFYDSRYGTGKSNITLSFDTLMKTNRFTPHYFHRSYFEAYRKHQNILEKQSGMDKEDLINWLKKHRCRDTANNRFRYFIYRDLKKKGL